MYKIVGKKLIAENIYSYDIKAERVVKAALPGQFIIVIADESGERVPLTICDKDESQGTINIVFQTMGSSTKKMSEYEVGDSFSDFVGPLGQPSNFINEDIERLKKESILFVAGGVGAAPVYPQAKWLHDRGVKVDIIVGTKTKDSLILEEKLKTVCENIYVSTDDGSYGYKGMVTGLMEKLMSEGKDYSRVISIGPMIMMKFVCELTKKLKLPTIVSLNPIMVDGTGMCGACRVSIDNKIKFACVDGPEFDGHLVDFDEALKRQTQYKSLEDKSHYKCENHNKGGCQCDK